MNEKKRKYNSFAGEAQTSVTQRELEEYHRGKQHFDDPMRL
jgi:hypothetical protein